jgi:hypothetical protein
MTEKFKVGDKVQVHYLTDAWIDVVVVNVRQVEEKDLPRIKKYYPDVKAGDQIVSCGQDINDMDTREFLPPYDAVRSVEEPSAALTRESRSLLKTPDR